jgi:hypothetical protein
MTLTNIKYTILDDLPIVPEHLILSLSEVVKLTNWFRGKSKNYTIHECQDNLREYLQNEFPKYEHFRYQTLVDGVPIHKDRNRTRALNYIIDAGGSDVHTIWYDEDKITPICDIVLPTNKWHILEVDSYHTITNIKERRFAITIA